VMSLLVVVVLVLAIGELIIAYNLWLHTQTFTEFNKQAKFTIRGFEGVHKRLSRLEGSL